MVSTNGTTSSGRSPSKAEASAASDDISLTPAHEAAWEAWHAGLNPFIVREDGSKRPARNDWKQTRSARVNRQQLDQLITGKSSLGIFSGSMFRKGRAGQTTNLGIECLDFDDRETFDAFIGESEDDPTLAELVERILAGCMEETPSGGIHTFTICEEVTGNRKLAQRIEAKGLPKALIETRGVGGWVVTSPSNGSVHPSGGAYVRVRGGFATIVTITRLPGPAHLARKDLMPDLSLEQAPVRANSRATRRKIRWILASPDGD